MSKKNRNINLLLFGILGGIIIIIIGFIYDITFAGIPYQDPTPEMVEKYSYHRTIAESIELIGLMVIIFSIIINGFRKIIKSSKNE